MKCSRDGCSIGLVVVCLCVNNLSIRTILFEFVQTPDHQSSRSLVFYIINLSKCFLPEPYTCFIITYFTSQWQLCPPPQVCAGVQAGRGRALLPPAVRQLWGTEMPKTGCPLQWHPVWWDAAWIQQQNPASQLGTDIPNDLPVTSEQAHTFDTYTDAHLFYAEMISSKNYLSSCT